MKPVLTIATRFDIKKLLAFLRAGANVIFHVVNEKLREPVMQALRDFADTHQIAVRVMDPSTGRLVVYGACGMLAGAAIGGLIAGVPGSAIGAVAGVAVGSSLAHLKVTVQPRLDGGPGFAIELARP